MYRVDALDNIIGFTHANSLEQYRVLGQLDVECLIEDQGDQCTVPLPQRRL